MRSVYLVLLRVNEFKVLSFILFLSLPLSPIMAFATVENEQAKQSEVFESNQITDNNQALLLEQVMQLRSNNAKKAIALGQQLISLLQESPNDKLKAALLSHLGWAYMVTGDYQQAISYVTESETLAKAINDLGTQALALSNRGTIAFYQNEFEQAMSWYQASLVLREQVKKPRGIADSLNNVALIHSIFGDYANALKYYLRSLAIYEQLEDHSGIATSLLNLGVVYSDLSAPELALEYYLKSLAQFEALGDIRSIAAGQDNMARLYFEMKDYDRAFKYIHLSLENFEKIGDKNSVNHVLLNLGKQYQEIGKLEQALETLQQGLQDATSLDIPTNIAFSKLAIGEIYATQGRVSVSLDYANEALAIFTQLGEVPQIRDSHRVLSDIYLAAGDYENALKSYQALKKVSDDLLNSDNQQTIAQLKVRWQVKQMAGKISLLEKEKALQASELAREQLTTQSLIERQYFHRNIWLATTIAVVIIGLLILAFYYHKQRVAKQIALERLRVRIATDLHDDLGASLTRISLLSDLVNSQNNEEKFSHDLQKISTISREAVASMSDVIWSIDARYDSLNDLVTRMHNCTNDLLRERNIDVNFHQNNLPLNQRLAIKVRQNLYLIFKEACNNCAKYANAGTVDITLGYDEQGLYLSIIDNGDGMDLAVVLDEKSVLGCGLKNMKMRAERLNAKLVISVSGGVSILVSAIKIENDMLM